MASRIQQLGFGFILLALAGCGDRRAPDLVPQNLPPAAPVTRTLAQEVAQVRYRNAVTTVLQMTPFAGSLFVTGAPFGFSRWDITASPENPSLTFAAATQQNTFAPKGAWSVDNYALGALTIAGNFALMSGNAGLSVINIANVGLPQEVARLPDHVPTDVTITADPAYQYAALAVNSAAGVVYGFRQQDYVVALGFNASAPAIPALGLRYNYAPGGTPVCCVRGATVFQNRIVVAFSQSFWTFGLNGNGDLGMPTVSPELQAVNVTSSDRLLFIQHEPAVGQPGANRPRGIYVYNSASPMVNVDFIPLEGFAKQIAVNAAGTHLYVNFDNTSVRVLRILWANGSPPQ